MESYLTSEESVSHDARLRQMESQFTGFNADMIRAIFDPNYDASAAAKEGRLSPQDFRIIQMKKQMLKQLAKMSPMARPSMREVVVALLKGLERKFEFDKVHSIEHDSDPDRWYPDDIEKMVARAIRSMESKSK